MELRETHTGALWHVSESVTPGGSGQAGARNGCKAMGVSFIKTQAWNMNRYV